MNTDITVFTDQGLTWELDMDESGKDVPPRSPSLYIKSEGTEIRQFCTVGQLYDLQRLLDRELAKLTEPKAA